MHEPSKINTHIPTFDRQRHMFNCRWLLRRKYQVNKYGSKTHDHLQLCMVFLYMIAIEVIEDILLSNLDIRSKTLKKFPKTLYNFVLVLLHHQLHLLCFLGFWISLNFLNLQ